MALFLWKFLKATIVGFLVIFVCTILVVIVINAKDQPPSDITIQFHQSWDDKVPVDPLDNGYLYLLGFDAEKNKDPRALGDERARWLIDVINSQSEDFFSFPSAPDDFRRGVPLAIQELVDACFQVSVACVDAIKSQREIVNQWSDQEKWILDRYRKLIGHTAWLDVVVPDMRLPLPNYADVMKAQRLTYINAFSDVSNNHEGDIVALLNGDLRFWRVMLKESDTLIGKMIAVAAIKNNFMWTNHFLLELKINDRDHLNLMVVDQPFTDEELSMKRCLIGEWLYASSYVDSLSIFGMDSIGGGILISLVYQEQDTLNMFAENINTVLSELDVPLVDFEDRLLKYQKKEIIGVTWSDYLRHPYNMIGWYLKSTSPASLYTEYVVRTKDLEGFRRGLLLSIEMMRDDTKTYTAYLGPYKSKPFIVDQKRRSLTVIGLGEIERATQTYYY